MVFFLSDVHYTVLIFSDVYYIVVVSQGRIQNFKLGGALKIIAPSGVRRENVWGITLWLFPSDVYYTVVVSL